MVAKKKPEYIKLKQPEDVLAYVQRLLNNIRRNDLELNSDYTGKIIYLLNTWLAAYKTNLESIEMVQLREEIAELKKQVEVRGGPVIRLESRQD